MMNILFRADLLLLSPKKFLMWVRICAPPYSALWHIYCISRFRITAVGPKWFLWFLITRQVFGLDFLAEFLVCNKNAYFLTSQQVMPTIKNCKCITWRNQYRGLFQIFYYFVLISNKSRLQFDFITSAKNNFCKFKHVNERYH